MGNISNPERTIQQFNPLEYSGRWYELVRSDNPWQPRGTTATADYSWNSSIQRLTVTNTSYDQDKQIVEVAKGEAWIPNMEEPGKLLVNFTEGRNLSPFPSPYWIRFLDYRRFSVVTSPRETNWFWILSREPCVNEQNREDVRTLLSMLYDLGYRTEEAQIKWCPRLA